MCSSLVVCICVKIRQANSLVCRNGGQECLTLVLTHLRLHQRTNIGFSDFQDLLSSWSTEFQTLLNLPDNLVT